MLHIVPYEMKIKFKVFRLGMHDGIDIEKYNS